MNWRRIFLLFRFDLWYSLCRLRGWVFLLPFALCWFVVFKQINKGVTGILQSQEGIAITSAIYGTDGALSLFVEHPPSVSLFYLISLTAMPFFAVLAAYDQLSTDLGSGFFRFLSVRCKRIEILLARFMSSAALIAGAWLIATVIAATLSIRNDDYTSAAVLTYSTQTYLFTLVYALPFIAYMTVISSLVASTLASLFLGMFGYALIWVLNLFTLFTEEKGFFSYLLPSAFKDALFQFDDADFYMTLAIMPVYTLAYASLAYLLFNRRNL